MKMQASKQFTLILAKYCKIVQSPISQYGVKARPSVVFWTRFLHYTQ